LQEVFYKERRETMLNHCKLQKLIVFAFLIIVVVGAFTSVFAQWEGWNYRGAVTISNASGSELTDFQTKIVLNSSTPFNFVNANNDGSDLRVTDSDEVTEIPFWIEGWNASLQVATIWVKVPSIPTTGTTIYLYYGNATANSASNGLSTFQFFDDFESWKGYTGTTGWTGITSLPDPASADNTIAVVNGKLYCIGGYGTSVYDYLDKVFEYDPGANLWTEKAHMPTARWGMIAVEFNGLIYVFGGQGYDNYKNEVYNPVNDTWDVTKADVPANLAQQGLMGVRYGDKIHLFYRSYHYEYDPVTDLYTQKSNVPRQLTWGTCATVGTKIYIIGGYSYDDPIDACNVNYEYDPATDTWATKTPMPVSRYGATRENPVINGKIYITHGHAELPFFLTNYTYNPATDTWEHKGPATYARDGVGCGVINNKLYVVGGRDVPYSPYGIAWAEVYDPAADTGGPPSGPELWITSAPSYVYADNSAKYQGNYGMKISQPSGSDFLYAQSVNGFGDVYALDFNWNVTSLGSGSGTWPETEIRMSESPYYPGPLYFYNVSGTQTLIWQFETTPITTSTRDSWHKVSFVRNGTNYTVTFDGITYGPYIDDGSGPDTGIFRFGQSMSTTQYIDNVRVRKYVATEPIATVDAEEANPLPVELNSFSALVIGTKVNLRWMTETEVNNYGFEILRFAQNDKLGWTKIGFVEGNGNSNSPKHYSFEDKNQTTGKYSYRLKQIDTDGKFEYSKVIEVDLGSPMKYELSQNYPNPFNPTTTIQFSLPESGNVKLILYNTLGQEVRVIVDEYKESGTHIINFDASGLNSGIYVYKLEANGFTRTCKMTLIK
jgi:N-acetylneuraminic acid mutarotase